MKKVILYWSKRSTLNAISVSNFISKKGSLQERVQVNSWDNPNVIIELRDGKTKGKLVEGDYQTVCSYIKKNLSINERQTNTRLFSDNAGYLTPEPPEDF